MIGSMELSAKRAEKLQLDHKLKDSQERVAKAKDRVLDLEQKLARAQIVLEGLSGSDIQRTKIEAQHIADHMTALQSDLSDARDRVNQMEKILKSAVKAHENSDHTGLAEVEIALSNNDGLRRELRRGF